MVPSGRGLACGLQDQRLMARPPARAGGRSGLLTGGESGKPNGSSLPSPKGYRPTFPARPAGGRAVTGLSLGGPQARYPVRSTASPKQPHQRRGSRGRTLLPRGFFPPFLPKKWGPGRAGPVPRRSNGVGKSPHHGPYPDRPKGVPPHPSCAAIFSASSVRYTHRSIFSSRAAFSRACSSVSSWSFT